MEFSFKKYQAKFIFPAYIPTIDQLTSLNDILRVKEWKKMRMFK